MAQCKLTPREFIVNAFSPQVAAVCSSNAEATCQRNNLTFIQLLQPFCRINAEGHIKDPQGVSVTVRSLQISIKDVNCAAPEPMLARKLLNESVSSSHCDRTTTVDAGKCKLDIPVAVPWFEAWRETFLNVQCPWYHEFTKYFLACMIVVSTADDDPKEKIQQIGSQLNQSSGKSPKWFNNNTLRYYILVHDVSQDDKKKAEDVFTEIKTLYGSNNCFLLQMNSRSQNQLDEHTHLPDPWSQFISKHLDTTNSDQSSSPRTPADSTGVCAMPNQVVTEPDKSSNAGTPLSPRNPMFPTTEMSDPMMTSAEMNDLVQSALEVGQEAVPITVHPLSPEGETFPSLDGLKSAFSDTASPINANVWADSPSSVTVQHGARLSREDLERLRTMMTDFCLKSLLPYVEKQINLLNDVISNKKGVSRSLFSATKRWFGSSKPGVPGSTPTNAVIYTIDSAELQLRRLGDLCFMFGHYSLAYQAYHNAKRDFAADQAWLYYAGALEMAALSAFMMDEVTRKTIEYMDEAILTYINTCKVPQFATRATLLSAECLKNRGLYGEAAKQLIRMTSEDSDLRSALLLEQAAYCFIGPRMVRKYAFHAVLAGHRFSKAGQKRHSLRCYQQAHQVYSSRGWSLAEDHIHFIIGRQAASLKFVSEAAEAFEKLLSASSRQPALQQSTFLREFLYIHNQLAEETGPGAENPPDLPLPLIDGNQVKVLLGPANDEVDRLLAQSDDTDDVRWSKLEQLLVTKAQGSAPMIFKPTITLLSNYSNNSTVPKAIVDEPVYYSVELQNPLQIALSLSDMSLICSFEDGKSDGSEVVCDKVENLELQPTSKQRVLLSLVPKRTGHVKVLGIFYSLMSSPNQNVEKNGSTESPLAPSAVKGRCLFEVKGKRLKNVKEKPGVELYDKDYRLEMKVFEKAPFMKVSFSKLSPEMLCGEIQKVEVELQNIGSAPLTNIRVATTNPQLFSVQNSTVDLSKNDSTKPDDLVSKLSLPPALNDTLQIGATYKTTFWVRAPHKKGNHRLDLLFYYENPDKTSTPRYRTARHTWHLTVMDSIYISAITRRSAKTHENGPTLNLTVHIKNTNQVHDPSLNEIELTNIYLLGPTWSLLSSDLVGSEAKIQPQEMIHFLLKLHRSVSSKGSDLKLCSDDDTAAPYLDFVRRRNAIALDAEKEESQMVLKSTKKQDERIAVTLKLDATLVLRWRVRVVEGGTVSRLAIGQHHIDIEALNKPYNHPNEVRTDKLEQNEPLKIFGPDANVNERRTFARKDGYLEEDYLKNVISYTLQHERKMEFDFVRSRVCIVPIKIALQNNSKCPVFVRIDTVGTSSPLPSDRLISSVAPKHFRCEASTHFRYVGQTAVRCEVPAFGSHSVLLHALLPMPGTYDLASRLSVAAKPEGRADFTIQDWHVESVCIVGQLSPAKQN